MTAGRAFALVFIAAFCLVGFIDRDHPAYYAAGFTILAGFALLSYGATHRIRR